MHTRARNSLISQKVYVKLFLKSPFPHKTIDLFFILVMKKDMLTDLWWTGLLQNDFQNTVCGIRMDAAKIRFLAVLGPKNGRNRT